MPQVDFAPTLAMLLGVPIPYGSIGRISPELWALGHANVGQTARLDEYQEALRINAWQVVSDAFKRQFYLEIMLCDFRHAESDAVTKFIGAKMLNCTAFQVHRYLNAYAERAALPKAELAKANALYERATAGGAGAEKMDGNPLSR